MSRARRGSAVCQRPTLSSAATFRGSIEEHRNDRKSTGSKQTPAAQVLRTPVARQKPAAEGSRRLVPEEQHSHEQRSPVPGRARTETDPRSDSQPQNHYLKKRIACWERMSRRRSAVQTLTLTRHVNEVGRARSRWSRPRQPDPLYMPSATPPSRVCRSHKIPPRKRPFNPSASTVSTVSRRCHTSRVPGGFPVAMSQCG